MVVFDRATKIYNGLTVVDHVSLEFPSQSTHVLIGQSGCGKSTLVRLATGLIRPNEGRILLDGREASSIAPAERARAFGYMVQDGGLFPHLTCRDNILLPARVHGLIGEDLTKRYNDLCAMVELPADLLDRYPRQISGGQRQRVALIRSLILDPPILFLDEPLGALDPLVRNELQQALRATFRSLKKTVIIVTHDLSEAAYFADTLTLIKDGHVEQHGSLESFLEAPKTTFVTDYFKAQRPPPRLEQWIRR